MGDIRPKPPPVLNLPASSSTVRVQAVDSTTRMSCNAHAFVRPPIENHTTLNLTTLCFLIEHKSGDGLPSEFVLFDCGSRKDYWNSSPQTKEMIATNLVGMQVDYNMDEILMASGLDFKQLKSVIWSHWHWDHIGDGSKFPPSVDIVVGPGFESAFSPGWPERPDSPVLASDLKGHRLHEPLYETNVAGFAAHDYFGDGSFYILDVPGHATGHICGLARTTPESFVFLGADAYHFAGVIRPTAYVPMPATIPVNQLDVGHYQSPCSCSHFSAYHPATKSKGAAPENETTSRTQPFYDISTSSGSVYVHPKEAQESVDRIKTLDAHPCVFVCVAHDNALFEKLPLLNSSPEKDINDWQTAGYKTNTRWAFLNELPKSDGPGRSVLVKGLRRADNTLLGWNGTEFVDTL
ncbi:hypothetical protein SEUCBS139899_005558 [Sporothrix eucalyptigena]